MRHENDVGISVSRRKMEVPGRAQANIVVAIAVPVVDIEAVLIKVADARNIVGVDRRERRLLVPIYATEN